MLSMIFACENGAIGKEGDLPWRQSTDLQHFKRVTWANCCHGPENLGKPWTATPAASKHRHDTKRT